MREFESGATRDSDDGKYDYEGFFSPAALNTFAAYMNEHRIQADGKLRDSDNWQRGSGIPKEAYMKSLWRHFFDVWAIHRGYKVVGPDGSRITYVDALCASLFNLMGLLHEATKGDPIGHQEKPSLYKKEDPWHDLPF